VTDRQTDRPRYTLSVTLSAMRPNNNTALFYTRPIESGDTEALGGAPAKSV